MEQVIRRFNIITLRPHWAQYIISQGLMFLVSMVDYHWLRGWTYGAYLIAIGLLIAVLVAGTELNGCKRWLSLGVGTIQPSEIAKFAVILLMAHLLTAHERHPIRNIKADFV